MKVIFLALLTAGMALQPGSTLQCYSCLVRTSNEDCLRVSNCSSSETQCQTEHVQAIGLLTFIRKGCSSDCVEDVQNFHLGKKNITCCDTDLCNASGAPVLLPVTTSLALLTALGSLLAWGPCLL